MLLLENIRELENSCFERGRELFNSRNYNGAFENFSWAYILSLRDFDTLIPGGVEIFREASFLFMRRCLERLEEVEINGKIERRISYLKTKLEAIDDLGTYLVACKDKNIYPGFTTHPFGRFPNN